MKKSLSVILCFMLAFNLTACGEKKAADTTAPQQETTTTQEDTATDTADDAATADTTDDSAAADTTDSNIVTETAMSYFADFADDKNVIKPADLFAKMDAGEDMVIIDIRKADAYGEGHLKGAVNLPYGVDIANALELIPDDVPVYVNCYTGQTSSQTTALLRAAGKYAYNIQSGYNNGISQTENYENYQDTVENKLSEDTYEVDPDIKAAITDYYTKASSDNFSAFNFPVDSLKELVEAESEDYTILSVRQAEDYAAGHIAGAINIPFAKGMQESFSQIPTDKPVVVYCYTGQTASQVMAILRLLGYEAYNLSGGMGVEGGESGWLGASLPVVTE